MARAEAPINQCPPGGAEGIARLATISGRTVIPLNPEFGTEGPRHLAFIDEDWCIGCTLCIKACPTDAIIGTHKRMHTVMEAYCTGCELCLPVCPVDCIKMEVVQEHPALRAEWTSRQALEARGRYEARQRRLAQELRDHAHALDAKARTKLADLAAHSQHTDPVVLDKKRAVIEAALQRARARQRTDAHAAPEQHTGALDQPE